MTKNTRQHIIDYSSGLLRARGYTGFSFLDIAREFDIKKSSVHHHFPKKADLGLALCDWTQQWLEQGLAHFDAKGTSQWNKLERYLNAAQKHILNEQLMCPISAFHNDLPVLDGAIKDRLSALGEIELSWVTEVITTGINNNEFLANDDPRGLAGLFVFSCKGALYNARLEGKDLFRQTMLQFEQLIKSPK
jgi:TetR/AcrR family transcriptional repressor of nem operon